MSKTRKTRLALLAAALVAAVMILPTDGRLRAQDSSREDKVVKLAGKKLRLDQNGRLRPITTQEAREMVATLTAMTAREEVGTSTAASGGEIVHLAGFDHVVIGRPNGDGTVEAKFVSSVDEAVAFFDQQSAANGQE